MTYKEIKEKEENSMITVIQFDNVVVYVAKGQVRFVEHNKLRNVVKVEFLDGKREIYEEVRELKIN